MRKSLVSLAFVSLLSMSSVFAADAATDEASASAVAVRHSRVRLAGLRDQAAMVLVGTALIGLASAVRRTA